MYKLLLTRRAQLLLAVFVVALGLSMNTETAKSQCDVIIPKLNLTGTESGYNTAWYPDGRIWLPPSTETPREFLMPVFMEITTGTFAPIKSFELSIQYNSRAFRAVGVQTDHPYTYEEASERASQDLRFTPWKEPLAKDFLFSHFDHADTNYTKYIYPTRSGTDSDPSAGRTFRIVAASTSPLPATSYADRKYEVLLYVRFVVVPKAGVGMVGLRSPIIIDYKSIKYNGIDISKHTFKAEAMGTPINCVPSKITYLPDGTGTNKENVAGLSGLRNDNLPLTTIDWATYPERYLPGVLWTEIYGAIPEFDFIPGTTPGAANAITSQDTVIKSDVDPGYWYIANPITADFAGIFPQVGNRVIRVKIPDALNKTRLEDIKIESDSPWLRFRTISLGQGTKNPIPNLTRRGFIDYIDYGILGTQNDPTGKVLTSDGHVYLNIECSPEGLTTHPQADPEKEGIYVGHLVFSSPNAGVNPVKVRVTFILFKTPIEPVLNRIGRVPGIKLNITNSIGGSRNLIFGTGDRATEGIDTLYGECPYEFPLGVNAQGAPIFDARWFPVKPSLLALYPNGFWDFAASEVHRRSDSRDIRDHNFTARSHVFHCRFKANSGYPVVLTWDTTDFYPGAQLYIHDTRNGEYFPAVNMREATPNSDGTFSFTILDARVEQFMIEYTLPTVIDYVNSQGEPIIKEGWNLLSMPVRAINAYYENFYPNAMNIPMQFTQNQYQEPPDGVIKPGYGYFVKYDKTVDTKFPGTFIYDLDRNTAPFDAIRLYTGWNTIGAVSVPVGINMIGFSEFSGQIPDVSYTRQYGVWAYLTNEGYKEVSEILPGLGYWIKVNNSGYLKINVPNELRVGFKLNAIDEYAIKDNILSSATVLNLQDSKDKNGTLYISSDLAANAESFELPPTPFAEMFDVRFTSNKYLSNENESIVRVQGIEYPMNISIRNADANYTFVDAVTGEVFGTINKGLNNTVTIKGTSFDAFKVIKSESIVAGVSMNASPNPVLGVSTVNFASVENEMVSVKLYDALGNEVMTLVNEVLPIGNHSVSLNATSLSSGSYLLKLIAGNRVEVVKVNVVK